MPNFLTITTIAGLYFGKVLSKFAIVIICVCICVCIFWNLHYWFVYNLKLCDI